VCDRACVYTDECTRVCEGVKLSRHSTALTYKIAISYDSILSG
jgi:hypothetical protein